jgi:hypothetical protein
MILLSKKKQTLKAMQAWSENPAPPACLAQQPVLQMHVTAEVGAAVHHRLLYIGHHAPTSQGHNGCDCAKAANCTRVVPSYAIHSPQYPKSKMDGSVHGRPVHQ